MKKFYTPIDLNRNEIRQARIENLSSNPSTPVIGQVYFNTTDSTFYVYSGSTWLSLNNDVVNDIFSDVFGIVDRGSAARVEFDTSGITATNTITFELPDTDTLTFRKNNLVAIVDPVASNDNTEGYDIGSVWLNTVDKREFVCVTSSTGVAVWTETTNYSNSYSATFSSRTTLNINHNLGTSDVIYKIYKDDGFEFIPESFQIVDNDNVQVIFTPATAGRICITGVKRNKEVIA